MKKFLLGMATLVAMFTLTSCENVVTLSEGDAVVSFNVGAPAIRSFSDGMSATHLQYAFYDNAGNELTNLTKTDADITGGSTTVEVRLTTGNTYSVLFWAAAPNAPYTVDFATRKMTIDYNNAVCSDENRDAFYNYQTFTVTGSMSISAELKRPFAQLNIGTDDYAASASAGHIVSHSKVTVPAYSTLDFANGLVGGQTEVTFAYAAKPQGETFPYEPTKYEYLAMTYVLMAADDEAVDVTFYYATGLNGENEKSRTIGSVPLQRNRRTNLYGSLFTETVIGNVVIDPDYDKTEGDINVSVPSIVAPTQP